MATFANSPVQWPGTPDVHIVTNSVHQRSAKFVRCGKKIGPDATYDGVPGATSYDFKELVPTCPQCIAGIAHDKERGI